ncbi:MAG: hypothetical protein JSU61_12255 [Fidelibacterota bacterium]|nr:MAG: hypothetical protein JSU61_12255 [Candidatus Neomarinimicrobiota bacterium]
MIRIPRASHIVLLLATLLLFSACLAPRLTDFTVDFRQMHKLTDDELRRVQFYNSHTIVLTAVDEMREPPEGRRRNRKLDTRLLDRVVIEEETPGMLVAAGGTFLDVSFEEGKALHFVRRPSGRFTLTDPIVTYDGRRYQVECVRERNKPCPVALMVRRKLKPVTKVQLQKVRGRRLR